MLNRLSALEDRYCVPSYGGGVILAIAICFFGAATNTMAGWLYVLCGTMMALLAMGAILPGRILRPLKVERLPIGAVHAEDDLVVQLDIRNTGKQAASLLECWDLIPSVLAGPQRESIEIIEANGHYRWTYVIPTKIRGVYRWQEVQLRTGAPLGLFWSRRNRTAPGKAIVYPQVYNLSSCPIVDTIGRDENINLQSNTNYQNASEGVTRTLRPYRYGDPTRLIHWRSSARLGEFRVRELEVITGGQEIIICLDTQSPWDREEFERAVIAAASLYFYASRSQLNVQLWTAETGLIHGNGAVLETLAEIEPLEVSNPLPLPTLPVIWLTQNLSSLEELPDGSRWLFFTDTGAKSVTFLKTRHLLGLMIDREESLQSQLQKPIN